MAINWKPCTRCKEEYTKLLDGLCAVCAGWSKAPSVDPGKPGAIVEAPRDFKSRAAGDDEDKNKAGNADVF